MRAIVTVVLLLAAVPVPGTAVEPHPVVTDQQLHAKAEEVWRACWERFYDERTHLFYDRVCSYDPKKRLASLPTPEEIGR
jgi:hypothetical protein